MDDTSSLWEARPSRFFLRPRTESDSDPLAKTRGLAALIAWLQDNLDSLMGLRIARLRLSRLHRGDPTIQSRALAVLADLARDPDIHLFPVPEGDVLVAHHQVDQAAVAATLEQFRQSLKRDPANRESITPGRDTLLVTWHLLSSEGEELLAWAERSLVDALNTWSDDGMMPGAGQRLGAPDAAAPPRTRGRPLTAERLAKLENGLATADLSSLVRRQRIVDIDADNRLDPVATELYVNIGDLRQVIAPTVDLASNPWLFRRFTATLDARLTTYMSGYVADVETPIVSLNLNVQTLLGKGRDEILATARRHADRTFILELRLDDILTDIPAYLTAREYAHQQGFKILIDALGPQALLWIDRRRLGADYLKAVWSDDMARVLDSPQGDVLRRRILAFGEETVIMSRCDDARAVEAGRTLGCCWFQGFYIDRLLRAQSLHVPPDLMGEGGPGNAGEGADPPGGEAAGGAASSSSSARPVNGAKATAAAQAPPEGAVPSATPSGPADRGRRPLRAQRLT